MLQGCTESFGHGRKHKGSFGWGLSPFFSLNTNSHWKINAQHSCKYVLLSRKGNCKPTQPCTSWEEQECFVLESFPPDNLVPAERELSGFSEELKHRFAKPVAH